MSITAPALNPKDLIPNTEYEKVREDRRKRAMAVKDLRRIAIGPHITLLFENRETLMYQIQEIMRAEKLEKPEELELEAKLYSALLPSKGELSAVLFIEVNIQENIRPTMEKMVGLDKGDKVSICFGDHQVPAIFEAGRSEDHRISAVQYIRFHFSPTEMEALAASRDLKIQVNHDTYQHQQTVPDNLKTEWLKDLLGA